MPSRNGKLPVTSGGLLVGSAMAAWVEVLWQRSRPLGRAANSAVYTS